MTPNLLTAILRQSEGASNEVCGLLVSDNANGAAYIPCVNIGGPDQFAIHPEEWGTIEDQHAILGVVHTHPYDAIPSEKDILVQKASSLPWWIINATTGEFTRFGAMPFDGRRFAVGVEDCYSLVRDYYKDIPDFLRYEDFWYREDLFLDNLVAAGFVAVPGPPQEGDGLLMSIFCSKINHCAVYTGHGKILHHLAGRLSGTEPYDRWVPFTKHVVRRAK